jgi:hypothetical protein
MASLRIDPLRPTARRLLEQQVLEQQILEQQLLKRLWLTAPRRSVPCRTRTNYRSAFAPCYPAKMLAGIPTLAAIRKERSPSHRLVARGAGDVPAPAASLCS